MDPFFCLRPIGYEYELWLQYGYIILSFCTVHLSQIFSSPKSYLVVDIMLRIGYLGDLGLFLDSPDFQDWISKQVQTVFKYCISDLIHKIWKTLNEDPGPIYPLNRFNQNQIRTNLPTASALTLFLIINVPIPVTFSDTSSDTKDTHGYRGVKH